jgi:hypothetical protein
MIIRNLGNTPNTIEVPRQTSFHIPRPGAYSSTIKSVSKKIRLTDSVPFIRILFNVQVPGANLDYLAKLDLKQDMNEGSDLWNVVCRLVGRKALQECSESEFDLNSLVNLSCDIEVDHVVDKDARYECPLVVVTNLKEAGTLVKADISKDN